MKRNWLIFAGAAAVLVLAAGTAIAGHMTSGVKSYTGCLTPGEGVLIKIKEGNAPSSACTGGAVQVHFSGGDITAISTATGSGLTGGGENGALSLALAPAYRLPQGCTSGYVAKWDGDSWECAADSSSTYTAGTGLDLSSGGEFSVEAGYRVKNTPDCASGEFATGFDSGGDIVCAPPAASSGLQTFGSTQNEPGFSEGVGLPDNQQWHTYASATLPAGSYILTGKGTFDREGPNESLGQSHYAKCRLFNGTQLDVTSIDVPPDTESHDAPFALTAPASGGVVELQCLALNADWIGIREARFLALKIG